MSLTVPGAQLVLVQPFPNDGGHVQNVGQIVQKDMIVCNDGQWMEDGLQTAQPVHSRGLALWEQRHREHVTTGGLSPCFAHGDPVSCTCSSLMVIRRWSCLRDRR